MKHYRGHYKEIKQVVRKGYIYPVEINDLGDAHKAADLIDEITGDTHDYHIVVLPKWSHPNSMIVWFQDPELATMVKLAAG